MGVIKLSRALGLALLVDGQRGSKPTDRKRRHAIQKIEREGDATKQSMSVA